MQMLCHVVVGDGDAAVRAEEPATVEATRGLLPIGYLEMPDGAD
jgi:hypothetical protein